MPFLDLASASEIDAAKRMLASIGKLTDVLSAYVREDGDTYKFQVYLEWRDIVSEQTERLKTANLCRSDLLSIVEDVQTIFMELSEGVAAQARLR